MIQIDPAVSDYESMDDEELVTLLGRIDRAQYALNGLATDVMGELDSRESATLDDSHCCLCGAELTSDLELDTGVCEGCAA